MLTPDVQLLTIALLGFALVAVLALCMLWQAERNKARLALTEAAAVRRISETRRQQLVLFYDILDRRDGGVVKRIDEHEKLAEQILKNAPHLIRTEHNVATWLNVNRGYLATLLAAVPLERE